MKKQKAFDEYLTGNYDNYEYGEPVEAAKRIQKQMVQVQKLVRQMEQDTKIAGGFLSPGMRYELKKELKSIVSKVR